MTFRNRPDRIGGQRDAARRIRVAAITTCGVWFVCVSVLAQDATSAWNAVYTAAQADRGALVYKKDCASCHGDGLNGVDEAPALTGAMFLSNWDGQSVADLVDLTRKSMPKDNENSLTRQQYVDVTAFVLKANGFPAGGTELPVSALRLGLVRIDAFKPAPN